MKNTKHNYKQVASILEALISKPPAKAGLRLLPEHELASKFNISRMKMRRALDLLFNKGYLSRSRGCGTFLRKVVPAGNMTIENLDKYPSIFDSCEIADSGRTADNSQQELKLSFWHDFAFYDTNVSIMRGMEKAAADRGHSFSNISLLSKPDTPLEVKVIREMIEKEKYDGYLVSLKYASLFNKALDGMDLNRVFIFPGASQIKYEPVIQMNLFEATQRAIYKLHESGYRRIAILSQDRNYWLPGIYDEAVAYNLTMDELKLDFRKCSKVSFNIESIKKAFFDMFDESSEKPDSIYIADEHLLPTFVNEIEQRNIKMGHDLGVIVQHSSTQKLFNGIEFSRMEFDIKEFGAVAIDTLIQSIMTAGRKVNSLSLNASWKPGSTHIKN